MFLRSSVKKITSIVSAGLFAAAMATAQQQVPAASSQPYPAQDNGPWAPVGQGQPTTGASQQPTGPYQAPNNQQPVYGGPPNSRTSGQAQYGQQVPYGQQGAYNLGPNAVQNQPPMQPVPSQLTIPPGTFLTVRINQTLSSDHNQSGDGFSASLVQPLVVNGVVVAEPGQTIGGQVVEAQKAGRVEGTARLGVQLTELTLVDGQQMPLRTSLVNRSGGTSVGRDAGAIAGTTGLGAAIGAAAGWGTGAAIGAGAGAVAGTLGVLLTRGRASVLYPEQVLTFRIEAPISVDTSRSTQAFRYVQPNEYDRPIYNNQPPPASYAYNAPVAAGPVAPYGGYGYSYPYYYPYAYTPGFSLFLGSGYYGRGYYGGRSYYGGRGYYGGGYRGGYRGYSGGGRRR